MHNGWYLPLCTLSCESGKYKSSDMTAHHQTDVCVKRYAPRMQPAADEIQR